MAISPADKPADSEHYSARYHGDDDHHTGGQTHQGHIAVLRINQTGNKAVIRVTVAQQITLAESAINA